MKQNFDSELELMAEAGRTQLLVDYATRAAHAGVALELRSAGALFAAILRAQEAVRLLGSEPVRRAA